jgi:hypothetical protein
MDRYPGMDGLKTGFTDASGFNLASTAVRDGHRLFGVVLGSRTARPRRDQADGSPAGRWFSIIARHPASWSPRRPA